MKIYYNGDKNKGGFRFLKDTICIDFVDENQPIEQYLKQIISYINENHLDKIFICAQNRETIDISFLEDCFTVEEIQISAFCKNLDPIYDIRPLKLYLQLQDYPICFEKLSDRLIDLDLYNITGKKFEFCLNKSILTCKKLKDLSISCFRNDDLELIARMSWIEKLYLGYFAGNRVKMPNLANMKSITTLSLQKVSADVFNALKELPQLNCLVCTQIPITSLDGIENLSVLQKLQMNYCSKLTDISAIKGCQNLEVLEFETCKNISDFTPLASLKNLRKLGLLNCGEIPSLQFIQSLENLKYLEFRNTNILDGDLIPCLRLEYAGTNEKKHYNVKAKDLPNKYNN